MIVALLILAAFAAVPIACSCLGAIKPMPHPKGGAL